jgi:hypothetical protein
LLSFSDCCVIAKSKLVERACDCQRSPSIAHNSYPFQTVSQFLRHKSKISNFNQVYRKKIHKYL